MLEHFVIGGREQDSRGSIMSPHNRNYPLDQVDSNQIVLALSDPYENGKPFLLISGLFHFNEQKSTKTQLVSL
jgi:hypothetical protein